MKTQGSRCASFTVPTQVFGALSLVLVSSIACAGNNSPSGGAGHAGGGSSGTSGSGGGGTGPHTPDVPIDGKGGGSTGVSVGDGTLAPDSTGQLSWLVIFENTRSTAICPGQFTAKLFDANGELLAGSEPGKTYLTETLPGFAGEVTGSPHQNGLALQSCIAPNGRGLGRGNVFGQTNYLLTQAEVAHLLEVTARIEYQMYTGTEVSPDIRPADEVLTFDGVSLGDGASGKVVRGTAIAGANLNSWGAQVLLWDSSNRIVDFTTATGNALAQGSRADFETPAVKASAARTETFAVATVIVGR